MSSIAEKPTSNLQVVLAGTNQLAAAPISRPFEQIATAAEVTGDFLAVALAVCAAYGIYHWFDLGKNVRYPTAQVLLIALAFGLLFVLLFERDGAYREGHGLLRVRETARALRVSTQAFVLALPVTFLAAHLISRLVLGFAFVMVPLAVITEKQIFFVIVRTLHLRGRGLRRVLIYGAGFTGKRVFSALVRSPKLGLEPVAIVDDDPGRVGQELYASGYRRERCAPIVAGPLSPELMHSYDADMVVIAIPTLGRNRFGEVAAAVARTGRKLAYVPSQSISSDLWVDYADVDGLLLASFGVPTSKALYDLAKRMFDFVISALILIGVSPLLAAVALAVKLDSEGPIIFRQRRVGKNGRVFDIYKFRSMRVDAPKYDFHPREAEDPRITRTGRWLRKTSLDELPQLFNVLRGEMSLVGPRPEMPFIVDRYGPRERQRLSVMPGITGLWQLSADRAYLIHENLQYDLYYIRNRGFFMDLAVLLHTAVFAMRGV